MTMRTIYDSDGTKLGECNVTGIDPSTGQRVLATLVRDGGTVWYRAECDWCYFTGGSGGAEAEGYAEAVAVPAPVSDAVMSSLLAALDDAADEAAKWEGWEWAHDPGGIVVEGPGAEVNWSAWETARRAGLDASVLDDAADMTRDEISESLDNIAASEREYGEDCQRSANAARECGAECVRLAHAGRYLDALTAAEAAAREEEQYGDDPSYAPLVAAAQALVDAAYPA